MKFRPLHDRIVVKRIDAEEKTKGGIIIPDTAKEKPQEGEVVAVGAGADAQDFAFLRLFLRGVGNDDPALSFVLFLDSLHQNPIAQRPDSFHGVTSSLLMTFVENPLIEGYRSQNNHDIGFVN